MNIATTLRPDFSTVTPWERAAHTRWGSYVTEVERRMIAQAHILAGPRGDALEVGCEGGRWSRMLAAHGWRMTCTDVDRVALASCQARLSDAKCILVDPTDTTLPCASSSQDLLLCIEVAPVIQSDWFLGEAARVLRNGGIFVGVCWNRNSVRGAFVRLKASVKGERDEFYRKAYPPFRRELVRNRFELVQEEGFCWGPFSRESNSPFVPGFVAVEKLLCLNLMASVSPWVGFIARRKAF